MHPAPWAWRQDRTKPRAYLVPTLDQLEACACLIDALTSCCVEGVEIPREWAGLHGGTLALSAVPGDPWPDSGIHAHAYEGVHSDGGFPVLYAYLRLVSGLGPQRARNTAIDLAHSMRAKVGAI